MQIDQNKVFLAWPNYIESSSLVGGNFLSTLPLNNVKNPVFSKKARTVDTASSSSSFDVVISGKQIDCVVIAAHNISSVGKVRFRWFNDLAKTDIAHDSGELNAWPSVTSTEVSEWEYDSFWTGSVSDAERDTYTPLTYYIANDTSTLLPAVVEVQIIDPENPDGYIEFGRVFVGRGFQPTLNFAYGAQIGFEIDTQVETALSGTQYFDVRTPKRTAQFTLDALTESEAHDTLYRLQRTQGIDKEVFFTYRAYLDTFQYNRTFIARLKQADPISQPYPERFQNQINLIEVL